MVFEVQTLCNQLEGIYQEQGEHRGEGERELEARHFHGVGMYYSLKHELPVALHARLIRVLMRLLWQRDGNVFQSIDLEVQAFKVLEMSIRQWKKRLARHGPQREEVAVDWRAVQRSAERACFMGNGNFRRSAQLIVMEVVQGVMGCAEESRTLVRSTDPSVPLVVDLWREFGASIKDTTSIHCFRDMAFFSLFFVLPPSDREAAKVAIDKLLPEWFATWVLISQSPEWDGHWMKIMSRIAKIYPDPALWKPYLPFVFAKIHDFLDFPSDLGDALKTSPWPEEYSAINGSKDPVNYAMRLCVFLLHDGDSLDTETDSTQPIEYMLKIFSVMKGFFHPSNVTNVAGSLAVSVGAFISSLAKRLGREKAATGQNRVRLSLEMCRPLLKATLELVLLGIYSKSHSVTSKCMGIIETLICIDPAYCTTPILDDMMHSLDPSAMSHAHLAASAITSMSVFLYHLMYGKRPETTGLFFSTYLAPILRMTLPGIDANDVSKTTSTVSLYFQVLSWLPLVNDSAKGNFTATKVRGNLSKELFTDMERTVFASISELDADTDQKLWELGAFLEEWSLELLDRCLQVMKSRSRDMNSGGHGASKGDGVPDEGVNDIVNLLALLYPQMSPPIYEQALRKTLNFLNDIFISSTAGGKMIARMIYKCMQGSPSVAFKHFATIVFDKFHVTKTGVDVSALTTSEKIWHLNILNGMVRFNDVDDLFLLQYQNELRAILQHFLTKEDDKEVYEAASTVLQHLLHALLSVYTHDFRSLSPKEWQDAISCESGAFQYMGVSSSWRHLSLSWHEPKAAELGFGFALLQEHLIAPLDELKEMENKKDTTVRLWLVRLRRVLHCVRGAMTVLVDEEMPTSDNALLSGVMPLLKGALCEDDELLRKFMLLKPTVMTRVHEIVTFWRENGKGTTHEIPLWTMLLRGMNQLLVWRGDHRSKFRMKEKENDIFKEATRDVASRAYQKARNFAQRGSRRDNIILASRNEMIERVIFFEGKRRYVEHFELAAFHEAAGNTSPTRTRALYEALLSDAEALLTNPYKGVNSLASLILKENAELYGRWVLSRLPSVIDVLEGVDGAAVLKEETVLGLVDMLSERYVVQHLWRNDHKLLNRVLVMLMKSNDLIVKRVEETASKSKVSAKVRNIFLIVVAHWNYVRLPSESASSFRQLLEAEPVASEQWQFQAMFLATLYPLVRPEELPIPKEMWEVTTQYLANPVMPVRQIALILFTQLVKAYKLVVARSESHLAEWMGEAEAVVYSRPTMEMLIDIMLNDRRSSTGSIRSAASEWLAGAKELVYFLAGDRGAYPVSAPLSSVNFLNQPRSVVINLNLSRVKLVEKLVLANPRAFFGTEVIEVLSRIVTEKLASTATEDDRHAALSTLAEWVTGSLRALIKMELSNGDNLAYTNDRISEVVAILKQILPQLSVADVRQWVDVFYVIGRPGNSKRAHVERLSGLTCYLLDELESSFAQATQEDYARQSKWLHFVESLSIHLFAAGVADSSANGQARGLAVEIGNRVIAVLRAHGLTHPYESIRHRAGKMLFVLSMYALPGSSAVPPGAVPLAVVEATSPLGELVEAAALYTPDGVENYAKERDQRTSIQARETVMMWLEWCVSCGEPRDFLMVMKQLLPVAMLSEKHGKPEVSQQARNIMDTIASWLRLYRVPNESNGSSVSDHGVDSLLNLLETHAASQAWKTRAAVLQFITTLAFYHWIFWSTSIKDRVQVLVRGFLTDGQREVQAMAKFALRSLIHHESPSAVASMSQQFTQEAEEARTAYGKLKRRYDQLAASNADTAELETARKRMKLNEDTMARSVLGMSATVLAHPHDLPEFVPPMVEALGKYLYVKGASSTVSFLGKEAKETLLEFKRTHQDNWIETKARLTPAQRSAIEDVALAPSYFT